MVNDKLKNFIKKYKNIATCTRFFLIYLVFYLIARYSNIYETGLLTQGLINIIVIGIILIYRFLLFAVAPAILLLWVIKMIIGRNYKTNKFLIFY